MSLVLDGTNGVTFPSTYTQADVAIGSSATAQTWINYVSAGTGTGRVASTTYTNSTGRPIFVSISFNGSGTIVVNGVTIRNGNGSTVNGCSFIVPNGQTYICSISIYDWAELR